jgi:hypothetical protein
MMASPPRRSWNASEITSRADNELTVPLPWDCDAMVVAVFPGLSMLGDGRHERPSQTLCRLLELGLSNPLLK